LQMTLEMMKELFGVAHIRDDEEEVSLSQPVTITVPPEKEEVPVLQGLSVAPEEEEFPAPAVMPPHGPPATVPPEEEEVPAAPLVPVSVFTLLFFLKNVGDSLLISTDFDCFRVLFVVRFSKLNCVLIADRCQIHATGKGNFLCHTSIFNNLYFNY
jgi:hypothetical protein